MEVRKTKRKPKRRGRPPKAENRTRTRALTIRLSDKERTMLGVIAKHMGATSISDAVRAWMREAYERARQATPDAT
jgi:hypothetical protein